MNTTVVRTGPNHALHAVLTVFTCGMWALVWIPVAILGSRTQVVQHQPPLVWGQSPPPLVWGQSPPPLVWGQSPPQHGRLSQGGTHRWDAGTGTWAETHAVPPLPYVPRQRGPYGGS